MAIQTLVVDRPESPDTGTVATTPWGQVDLVVTAMKPWKVVVVRTVRVFLQTVIAGLSAGAMKYASDHGVVAVLGMPWHEFFVCLQASAGIGAGVAVVCALQNALELFNEIDLTHPKLRG